MKLQIGRFEKGRLLAKNEIPTSARPFVILKDGEVLRKSNGAPVGFGSFESAENKVVDMFRDHLLQSPK